jgi:putative transcriptional regulator
MSIDHHPGDDLLLSLAAGELAAGPTLLVSAHLEGCAPCRARLHTLQALGGALLDDVEPAAMATDAWARTLARIDRPAAVRAAPRPAPRPALPPGVDWPRSLAQCTVSRWHWMGPGMRFARVTAPHDPGAALFVLRIGPGRYLPRHTHAGLELTQVLHGAFDDGRGLFAAGDFDAADAEVHHQPVVSRDGECICLAHVGGGLRFDGRVAAFVGGLIGM